MTPLLTVRSSRLTRTAGRPSFDLLQGFGRGETLVVLYAFDLLMLCGRDVRFWPLQERRTEVPQAIKGLPDTIRYSEIFDVPLADLERAVRENQLEGIVAKRAGSPYGPGERCGDWLKWRANRGQEFVIGGYLPNGSALDSLLVGYYEAAILCMLRAFAQASHPSFAGHCRYIFRTFRSTNVHLSICPTVAKDAGANGSRPPDERMPLARAIPGCSHRVSRVTPENPLRHPRFVGLRSDKDARE
jgi:bifunctional non-homologous end joining protein LigD